jgi:hypothetical protein
VSRFVAAAAVVALLLVADPLESRLRSEAPPAPPANRIGVGRLMGGVLSGAFRPLLLNYLWIRGDILYGEGRFDELHVLYRTMVALYPRNERAREFLGWNLAFNFKNEAPADAPEVAWRWARAGLDILADLDGAPLPVADWMLKQCGQNPLSQLRYAGPAWEAEKRLRARVRAWAAARYGVELDRFEIGLKVLEGRHGFADELRRCNLLAAAVYDDWMRTGTSPRLAEAVAASRAMAKRMADAPQLAQVFTVEADLLEAVWRGGPLQAFVGAPFYHVAAALWGLGAHRRDLALLQQSQAMFRRIDPDGALYPEEEALVTAWIAHVREGGPRPRLPFDA